jgi:peptidoglycan hydrolase-like protein with peptidoglycan-binding domain
MRKLSRRAISVCLVAVLAAGGAPVVAPATPVTAADPPWLLPTSPPRCTTEQMNAGNVATCVITLGPGLPENRGWPQPPFPEPENQTVIPWVDLALGAVGPVVAKVQTALVNSGAEISADGQFGAVTQMAVRTYQTNHGLASTGVVDQAMASMLGVQNTTGGTFPPTGWTWLGWGYNGSAALASFEAQLVGNQAQIGAMRPGSLRSFPGALPLFENFYAEIQARGYVIGDGGSYVFRCTASTRKDCAGLTRAALSNHAYGLASDINTAKNPLKTYYGVNGQTACQTAVVTDMPQWVVQVAEKWGLYWGGYGWSSGCQSPTTVRTSVSRDPMHFEFNGTPDQARAILRYNLGAGACINLVDENAYMYQWCMLARETPGPGSRIAVDTKAPAGATAALVNIATATAVSNGYITAEDCGARPLGLREWSNGNVRAGRTASATAIVALDAQGRFCLYQSSTFHSVVDVQGYFMPTAVAPSGNLYTPVPVVRALDTRSQAVCSPEGTCLPTGPVPADMEVMVTSPAAISPVAALTNITAIDPSMPGYVTADACANLTPGPQTRSNLNFTVGETIRTNMAVVPVAATDQGAQFCTYSPRQIQEVVDVTGYFNSPAQGGLAYTPAGPTRLVDTRGCWTDPVSGVQRCGLTNGAGAIVRAKAPAGATAVVVNLTGVQPTAQGMLIPSACATMAAGGPASPTVQASPGGSIANLAVVPVDAEGMFCVQMTSSMHVVIDLIGVFSQTGDLRFVPVSPLRLLDSRPPA